MMIEKASILPKYINQKSEEKKPFKPYFGCIHPFYFVYPIHHNKTKTFLDNFRGAKFMWFMFLKNCFLVHDMMIINYEIITVYISECVRDHWRKQMQVIYPITLLSFYFFINFANTTANAIMKVIFSYSFISK